MPVSVEFSPDPCAASAAIEPFLHGDPVRHNVHCTLLAARRSAGAEVRCWWARDGDEVLGAVVQTPTTMPANVTQLIPGAVEPLARALGAADPPVDGLVGPAASAASLAGELATVTGRPGRTVEGGRIYEVTEVNAPPAIAGRCRRATDADLDLVTAFLEGFDRDTVQPANHGSSYRERADFFVASGRLWLWENDDGPVGSSVVNSTEAGVARIGFVYTPPERRGRGVAAALVAHLSAEVLAPGARCILYTQLSNPTSNAIYQRIGYRPVDETIRYSFDPVSAGRAACGSSAAP